MTQLLIMRDKLIDFYAQYDYWLVPLVKTITALAVFLTINWNIGYFAMAKNPAVMLVAALFCSFLPWCAISLFASVFVLANLLQISFEMTVIAAILFLLFALIMVAFKPKHSVLIALLPVLYCLKIPYVIPVIAGLSIGTMAVIPTALGTIAYFLVMYFKNNVSAFSAEGAEDSITEMANKYADIINGFIKERYIMIVLAAFCITVLVVYVIRKLAINYAWNIAIVAGLLTCLCVILLAGFVMNVPVPTLEVLAGILVSALICFGYELMFYSVDYTGTEHLQFEDDDYYYYVKAVPKMKVSKTDIQFQNITKQ